MCLQGGHLAKYVSVHVEYTSQRRTPFKNFFNPCGRYVPKRGTLGTKYVCWGNPLQNLWCIVWQLHPQGVTLCKNNFSPCDVYVTKGGTLQKLLYSGVNPCNRFVSPCGIYGPKGGTLSKHLSAHVTATATMFNPLHMFVSAHLTATTPRGYPFQVYVASRVAATTPTSDKEKTLNIS